MRNAVSDKGQQAKRLFVVNLFEGAGFLCGWERSHVLFFIFRGLSLSAGKNEHVISTLLKIAQLDAI